MAAKGTRVTQKEKMKMYENYLKLGSYKKVAKRMRRSPDTVAKYIREIELVIGCQELYLCNGTNFIETDFNEK